MGIPYTHSGVETSVIAIDKELTKLVLVPHGIRMPDGQGSSTAKACSAKTRWRGPMCVKPVNEGSSVGVAIVTAEGNYGNPIGRDVEGPWHHFERLLAEPFIKGRELTVAVLGDEALAVTELKPTAGFYDYDAKYTDGLTDAHLPGASARRHRRVDDGHGARRRTALLGCKGASRSDFRWDDEQGEAGHLPARGQHPAGDDPAQPGARTGQVSRHRLWRIGRAADRGRAVTARGSGAAGRRGRARRKRRAFGVEEDRARSCRSTEARANRWAGIAFGAVPGADRRGRAGRAGNPVQGDDRGRRSDRQRRLPR